MEVESMEGDLVHAPTLYVPDGTCSTEADSLVPYFDMEHAPIMLTVLVRCDMYLQGTECRDVPHVQSAVHGAAEQPAPIGADGHIRDAVLVASKLPH